MSNIPAVLTIIAPEGENLINDTIISDLKSEINTTEDDQWLSKGTAIDIFLEAPANTANEPNDPNAIKDKITSSLAPYPFDFSLQPVANRRKKLLISDMDSTIIKEECIDEIAFMAGIKPKIADITERAMRGEIDFDDALKERVMLLKGLDTTALQSVINERLHLSKGAVTLVQTMAKHGAYCALVSGGFTYFTQKIADLTGFHTTQANTLIIENDKLTGHVGRPILGSAAKKQALEKFIIEQKITIEQTLAVGDGANDLEMIIHSGLGVAYKAKPIVAEKADAAVNHTDLTSLLYMQGYKQSEFAETSA